ncbi:minor tail protein [Streptomyces phage TrvxScott]|nr:minor tail protein [Streptomyces phage TrvxScott]
MPTTYYPYDNGTVGPTGPEGPQGPAGPAGKNGVVQSVNGQSVEAVVLDADDVGALPSNANATLNATYLGVSRPAGNYRVVRWMTDGTSRWEAQADDVAETGSGAGSDFRLASRNDDGSFNKTTVHAKRSDGTISFGTTTHHGSAQVTSSGSIGLRDVGTDPATTSGGVFLYSKSGKMFVKQADGTSFQIAQVSYPVTSVNGETGNVTLGAVDVGALPATAGEVMQTLPINGAAGSSRTLTFRTNSVNRWTLAAGTDAETGTNAAGSNLSLASRNDDGSYRATVIDANRSTGQVAIGGSTKLSDAKLTVINGVGVVNRTEDPAAPAQGFVMYAKDGLPYVIQADGTIFKVGSGGGGTGGAVDSVNGKTGIVELGAADVGAIAKDADVTTSGRLTSARGFVINSTDVNVNPIVSDSPAGQLARLQVMRVDGVDKLSLDNDGDLTIAGGLTAGGTSTVPNLRVGASASFAGASGSILAMANAGTLPTSNPSGVILYADAGVLKVRQQDGTDIVIQNVDLDDLGGIPYAEKAAANGVATLDSAKRVPVAQLPDFAKPSDFAPTDLGLKAWSSDPAMCSVQVVYPTSGAGRVTAVKINEAVSVSKIVWYFKGYAGGLKAGSWAGIYNSSGTLMRATGDLSTATYEPQEQHATGGGNSWSSLTSAVTLQPGLYYVVFRMVYTESPVDGPAILAYDNSSACPSKLGYNNMWRWASLTTSATSAPSSITVSSFAGDPKRFWVGLA